MFLFAQIDFDESTEQNCFVVKPGVDPSLDESKNVCLHLPTNVSCVQFHL